MRMLFYSKECDLSKIYAIKEKFQFFYFNIAQIDVDKKESFLIRCSKCGKEIISLDEFDIGIFSVFSLNIYQSYNLGINLCGTWFKKKLLCCSDGDYIIDFDYQKMCSALSEIIMKKKSFITYYCALTGIDKGTSIEYKECAAYKNMDEKEAHFFDLKHAKQCNKLYLESGIENYPSETINLISIMNWLRK